MRTMPCIYSVLYIFTEFLKSNEFALFISESLVPGTSYVYDLMTVQRKQVMEIDEFMSQVRKRREKGQALNTERLGIT